MAMRIGDFVGRVTVTDGAWGTQLQARGLPAGGCPDAWNVEKPSVVEAIAAEYVAAGSRIILTNTFRANRFVLGHWSLADRAGELAEAGAAISRKAAGEAAAVFGSIGPTGKIVMMREVPPEEIESAFAEQAAALARGGADAILCETFTELDELRLAIRAGVQSTDLPVVASMTFDSGPDKCHTMMGVAPGDLAAAAGELGAAAIGANCGAGPANYVNITRLLREATELPVWVKPNAGLPVMRDGQTVFPMGPAEFAGFVPALVEAGASFIGGCCGTTPAHVREIRRRLEQLA